MTTHFNVDPELYRLKPKIYNPLLQSPQNFGQEEPPTPEKDAQDILQSTELKFLQDSASAVLDLIAQIRKQGSLSSETYKAIVPQPIRKTSSIAKSFMKPTPTFISEVGSTAQPYPTIQTTTTWWEGSN